jgi:hypothetical protein
VKKSLSLLFIVSALLGMVLVSPTLAGSKKKAAPPPVQHHPVISSVTANSITVTEDKITKTLTINQFTEITVNGQRATAAELKPGMTVNVTLGTDATKASRINATGK